MEKKISEFVPDNINIADFLEGGTGKPDVVEPVAPVAPVTPAKPAEGEAPEFNLDARPKIADPKAPKEPEAKPEDKGKPGPKPADAMRQQIKSLSEQKDAEAARAAQLEKDQQAAKSEADALRKELEEMRGRQAELDKRSAIHNPHDHPRVRAISDPINAEIRNFAADASGATGADTEEIFKTIIGSSKMLADAKDDDEMKSAMGEIRKSLGQVFDDNASLMAAMGKVRTGAAKIVEIRNLMAEMQNDLPRFQYEEENAIYTEHAARYAEVEREAFNPPASLMEADPFHPSVVIRSLMDASAEVKDVAQRAQSFAKMVLLPPAPIPPTELAGLDEASRTKRVTEHRNRILSSRAGLEKVLAQALVARSLLPSLYERLSKAEGVLSTERRVIRAKGDGAPPAKNEEEGIEKPVTQFVPTNPLLDEFKANSR
jgi:hypothetical protein